MSEETKDKKSDKGKTEKRCFVMMPFSDQEDYPKGHFTKVYEHIFIPAIRKAGYIPYRVDENTISDSIINKIFEGVQNCEMAVCVKYSLAHFLFSFMSPDFYLNMRFLPVMRMSVDITSGWLHALSKKRPLKCLSGCRLHSVQ